MSDRQLKQLMGSDSVWPRTLTYAVFGERCPRDWKGSLLDELRAETKPVAVEQLSPLIAQLDSDDFDTREQASARLARLGERVEAQLRYVEQSGLSAEAGRRVREILHHLDAEKQPPECVHALEWLGNSDAPQAGEILEALSQGAPDAWLTQQAKTKLDQWRKRQPPPP